MVSFRTSDNREKVHFSDTEDTVEYVFQEHVAVRNHNFILYAACMA